MGDISNLSMNWRSVMMAMVCLPIVISLVVLMLRKTEAPACKYLALFLLTAVLSMMPQIIGYAGFYNVWPGLTYFPLFYLEAWLGPLLYVHGYKLMQGGPLGWRKLLFVPGLILLVYYLWAYFGIGDYQAKWAHDRSFHGPYVEPVESLIEIGLLLFSFVVLWRLVKRYRAYLEQTSSAALEFNPVWLKNLIIALPLAALIYAALEIADTLMPISYNAAFPFEVLIMLIVAWVAIDAAWRLSVPFPKMSAQSANVDTPQTGAPQARDWAADAQTLQARVVSEAWYLEPRLSIRDVAAKMGSNETYISRSLNKGMGQTFNRFINGLRVEHAKDLISENADSLLTIALDSGFNSKATFNRVFRDIAGMTPTQFKISQNP